MKDNPFVGASAFTAKQQELFFGREAEGRTLVLRLTTKRVVLFYAPSGAGKSSLLKAKVIPLLRRSDYDVLPIARVGNQLPAQLNIENVFVFSALMDLLKGEQPEALVNLELPEALVRLCEGRIKQGLSGTAKRFILILDQFEEIFSEAPHSKREEFFCQLGETLEKITDLGLIISMREDRVAEMDAYAHYLPGNFEARFRMGLLDEHAALEAIQEPAKTRCPFSDEAARELVNGLMESKTKDGKPDNTIEPVLLQVVCYCLWEKLAEDSVCIELDDVKDFDIDGALAEFYESALTSALNSGGENRLQEEDLRWWFEEKLLVLEGNTRKRIQVSEEQGIADLSQEILTALQKYHVIHVEAKSGSRAIELTHDRLIEPIRQSNDLWFNTTLQGKAALLRRKKEDLRQELKIARELAEQQRRVAEQARELAEQQRRVAEQQKRATRRLLYLVAALGVFLVVVAGLSIFATREQQRAERAAASARRRAQEGESLVLAGGVSQALNNDQPDLAVALAVAANSISSAPVEAQGALEAAVRESWIRNRMTFGGRINITALSPDGQAVLFGFDDGELILRDVASGQSLQIFTGQTGAVTSAAISPDGRYTLTVNENTTLWDVANGQALRTFTG